LPAFSITYKTPMVGQTFMVQIQGKSISCHSIFRVAHNAVFVFCWEDVTKSILGANVGKLHGADSPASWASDNGQCHLIINPFPAVNLKSISYHLGLVCTLSSIFPLPTYCVVQGLFITKSEIQNYFKGKFAQPRRCKLSGSNPSSIAFLAG
jgi:hypothetical protein